MFSHKKSRIIAANKYQKGEYPADIYKKISISIVSVIFLIIISTIIILLNFFRAGQEGDTKKIGTTRYAFVDVSTPKQELLHLLKSSCPEQELCQSILLRIGAKIPLTYPTFNRDDFVAIYIYDENFSPATRILWNCDYHADEQCLTALGIGNLMAKYHPIANPRLPYSAEEIQSLSK